MKDRFISLPEYGQLYIDRVLFQAGYPVLFTCADTARDLFICVCCQNNEQGVKWLISRTKPAEIVKLLENELTIRDIFTNEPTERFSIDSAGNEMKIVKNDSDDWAEDSIFLPKADEYMDAEPEEFEEEIRYYRQYDLKYTSVNEGSVSMSMILDSASSIIQILSEEVLGTADILGELVDTFSSEVEKILVESESMHLKENQKMLSEYHRIFASLKNKETICIESSKRNDIFDEENEMRDDLLIAA